MRRSSQKVPAKPFILMVVLNLVLTSFQYWQHLSGSHHVENRAQPWIMVGTGQPLEPNRVQGWG